MSNAAAVAADPVETEVVEEANPLSMSDEDIMNMTAPGVTKADPEPETPEQPVVKEDVPAEPAVEPKKAAAIEPVVEPKPETAPVVDPTGSGEAAPAEPATAAEPAPIEESATDYEGFYKQIMTPFKANGKTIQLKDTSEAIQLMQKGANYTRKMQELVPHRKTLTMLQNNNIDESKLSFLIDLDKKDPEAIKKLIKESGIDPMEIDTNSEPAYLGGNHRVTDDEVNFRSSLEELSSTSEGQSTLQIINSTWDQASKDLLWKNPETMAIIHDQREFGIYDRIAAEMDRQRTIGSLPVTTPFLQAYKIIGDQLTQAGAFKDLMEKHSGNAPAEPAAPPVEAEPKPAPAAVATRVVPPKPVVKDGTAASAASPTRATTTNAQTFVNPLSMSDDEFLKQFNGRL